MSIIERLCSRKDAFFQSYIQASPKIIDLKSDSVALSHVWEGLPGGVISSQVEACEFSSNCSAMIFFGSPVCDVAEKTSVVAPLQVWKVEDTPTLP